MDSLNNIRQFIQTRQMDYAHFTLARFLQKVYPSVQAFDLWLAVLLNMEISQGHVCLPVAQIAEKSEAFGWADTAELQNKQKLQNRLQKSPLIGGAQDQKPLILDDEKLYLNRYFHHEKNIADRLLNLSCSQSMDIDPNRINKLFDSNRQSPDFQKLAAIISARHSMVIISGGPGTGKTWTVSRILALILMMQPDSRIKLAAPTGKAAARMAQSIQRSRDQLPLEPSLRQQIPASAETLHRLLHIHRYRHRAAYHAHNSLPCDVLVLDEASMIDQQMMAMICAALPSDCKLILLGDKDQLASVEAGSVFADLCGDLQQTQFTAPQQQWLKQEFNMTLPPYRGHHALADQLVVLQHSHRFGNDSAIGQLARLINVGDASAAIDWLHEQQEDSSISWRQPTMSQFKPWLQQQALGDSLRMAQASTVEQAFAAFHHSQILSALWQGASGVDSINEIVEQALRRQLGLENVGEFYHGKPLMMTSNIYQYDIHNGDIGIVLRDDHGQLKIFFEQGQGQYRSLSLSQCPPHKTAYAMTVHKSQGSEFDHVLLLLPPQDSIVATRELLYTGITRAAQRVEIWAQEAVLKATIERKTERASGLMKRLENMP